MSFIKPYTKDEMENEVKKRNIKYLFHFTRLENLNSILINGLIPRLNLEQDDADVTYNDDYRLDRFKNANCLSISHPNYKMFYKLRSKYYSQEWVVIAFKPDVLWEKDCAFCFDNASSSNVISITIEFRKSLLAFEGLFYPFPDKPSRSAMDLNDSVPTSPQAEVLVFDIIEPKFILGVVTQNEELQNQLARMYSEFEFQSYPPLFEPRFDYEHW